MLSKFSVKKPFFVLVGVIIVLVLGGVSLNSMKTDLLPEFEVPYLAVITTDVGASPEQVETDVTDVLEGTLAKVTGVQSVQCISAENYSMVFMEFADGTNMDSALVKTSAAVNEVSSALPETCGTPSYMEISMDMMATMYLGVTDSKMSQAELTTYVNDTVVPSLERQDGVADVSVTGGVVNTVSIELDQDKIDLVNEGILGNANDSLAKAKKQLDDASSKLDDAEDQIDSGQSKLDKSEKSTDDKLGDNQASLTLAISSQMSTIAALNSQLATLQSQQSQLQSSITELQSGIDKLNEQAASAGDAAAAAIQAQVDELSTQLIQLNTQKATIDAAIDKLNTQITTQTKALTKYKKALAALNSGSLSAASKFASSAAKLADSKQTIESSRQSLEDGYSQYESNKKKVKSSANIDALLDINTLSQLISAQNLEMPAGYVTDKSGEQWMVKVGEKFTSVKQLKKLVLTHIDGVGDVTLADVANITTTDNVGDSYAKMNGEDALVLSVTKSSTANTGEVSTAVNAQIKKLEANEDSLDIIGIMDQGDYISLYIWTILKSLILGAILAVIVLALFLRDVKPTIIVAFSIPFSVLFAIVIMYFTGLELNIMTLGAMSLAIGMLVDNSIVVMENIYRLRGLGMSAPRASAQGARQVAGAVIASTLTTICVFFPMVFSNGTVRQLMVPFALTLSFVLVASLVVALTVVPAVGSRLFKNAEPKHTKFFAKVLDKYGTALNWCLRHKAPVLVLAVVLLGVSIAGVVNMGVVLIPDMTSNQLMITLEMPDDMEKEDAYKIADEAIEIVSEADGIADVGEVDSSVTTSMMMSSVSAADAYNGQFILYGIVDEGKIKTESQMAALTKKIVAKVSKLNCTVYSSDSMSSMSSMMDSGLTVEVTGEDYQEVQTLTDKVVKEVEKVKGYEEISKGQEDADSTLHMTFKKNKLARMGVTVGQIYQEIAADLSTSTTSFTLTEGSKSMDVNVDDEDYLNITKENLLKQTFEDSSGKKHKLSEVASLEVEEGVAQIQRKDGAYYGTVTAEIADGYNTTLLTRQLQPKLDKIDVPEGYSVAIAGTDEEIQDMLKQMAELMLLGFVLLYLVMVAQFQSLLSPFIIIFTVPLAFTGGLLALLISGEQLSIMSLLGFVVLMGTVVNNGIVFVDYANQMRLGGMAKRPALIATGKSRMRPILMTALTTILSMCALIFGQDIGSSMQRGMALVVAGGLLYATIMTLFVVPVVYDIFSRRPLRPIDLGDDIDAEADDAERFIAEMGEDAREKYDYESARDRRRRLKLEGGKHGKRHLRKQGGE